MTILGRFIKQPIEVEIYGIQFATDMASTDEITSAFQMITRESTLPWNGITLNTLYEVLLTDDDKVLVSTSDMDLPVAPPEGFRINVANKSQSNAINIDSVTIPARGSSIIVYTSGQWVEEAKTEAVLVNATGDQRVRVRVFGGTAYESYKVDVAVDTTEGRTLQDEFIVDIEES